MNSAILIDLLFVELKFDSEFRAITIFSYCTWGTYCKFHVNCTIKGKFEFITELQVITIVYPNDEADQKDTVE